MTRTVMDVFAQTVANYGAQPALRTKVNGQWNAITWQGYYDETRLVARAMIHLGLEKGKGVSIIGYNSSRWFMADIGAIMAGGVPAGIYTTNSPEQCQYITHHCEAAIAMVENTTQLEKFKAIRGDLPHLKAIVLMEGDDADSDVYSWEDFLALAEKVKARGGLVNVRSLEDGSETPYELNVTYFSALSEPDDPALSEARFLCSQAVALAMRGIPALYFHSFTATPNYQEGVKDTGHNRTINRRKWKADELDALLDDPSTPASRAIASTSSWSVGAGPLSWVP